MQTKEYKADKNSITANTTGRRYLKSSRNMIQHFHSFQMTASFKRGIYETERRGRGYYDNGVPLDENISAAGAVESAEDAYFRELLADEIEAARKALCQERMARVKALLTAKQYRRIWMYLAEGKSITEIAKAEGLSKASVSRSIAAALHKLRKLR